MTKPITSAFPVLQEIADPSFGTDPAVVYRAAHARSAPGIFEMPNGDGLAITSFETLNALKTNPQLQAQIRGQRKGGSGGEGALVALSLLGPFFMNEPEHLPTAQAVYRPMSPARNNPLVEQITAIANRAIDAVLARGEADLVRDYAFEIASRFWLQFLGVPIEMREQFAAWSAAIVPMLAFERSEEEIGAANKSAGEMLAYLADHYRAIAGSGRETAFHLMAPGLAASDVAKVPDDPAGPIAAMTFDGIDSVSTATANMLYTCLRHPEQFAMLREDRSLVSQAWREAVRFEPSLLGLHRSAREPIDYAGVIIPKDVNIFMMWAAANRDPRVYDEPDRFDIRRSDRRILTFGGGIRICKGRHLVMLQGEIALKVLLEKTRDIELLLDDPAWGRPGMIRAIQSLPVRVSAH